MAGNDYCLAFGFKPFQQVDKLLDAFLVDAPGWLVQKNNVLVFHDGLDDADFLPHADRVFANGLLAVWVQVKISEQLLDLVGLEFVVDISQETKVVPGGFIFQKAGVLDQGADHVAGVQADRAAVGLKQAGDDLE